MSPSQSKRWKALIVDDEELARHVIREFLQSHAEIEIAAECANGIEAVKAVAEHKPNLIFLDVQMPKLTGFDVLELIGTEMPVIFVTAYDQYAMRAFDVHAVDYLLKPIGRERFDAALERAKNRLGEKMPYAHELAASARPPQQFLERLVVKDGTKVTLIPVAKLTTPRPRTTTLLSPVRERSISSSKPSPAWRQASTRTATCASTALTS
jgi:two-component system LytT family response regulator